MISRRGVAHAVIATALAVTALVAAQPGDEPAEAHPLAVPSWHELPAIGAAATAAARPVASARRARVASIWLPSWDMADAVTTVTRNADLFHTASMFWYDASCGRIRGEPGAGDRRVISRLRQRGIAVVATVTGNGLGPRDAVRCFGDAGRRAAHIRKLVRLVRSRPYSGIDLDYESLALTGNARRAARVRATYTRFVRELCPRIRKLGKTCTITVMSRTDDQPAVVEGRLSTSVFDYTAISAAATRMRVMTYDQHTRYSPPGPVAGMPWVRRVVAYVKAHTDESKVELGVPLYGRNWGSRSFDTLLGDEGFRLARRHGKRVTFDRRQQEYTFGYRARGQRHRVWFSGPASEAARVRLAEREGLAGVAFWAAGQQQRRSWSAVRNR